MGGSGEDGEDRRLLSRRQGWGLHLLLHARIFCNAEKWVSAIHMLLMALIPTSEVSGKLSTGLGKTGGGPQGHAVVRRCSLPALTRCRNLAVAGLMGREMPRGVLNASVSMLSRLYH